jgi:hypothetical protein
MNFRERVKKVASSFTSRMTSKKTRKVLIFVTSGALMSGQAGAYEGRSILAEALACAGEKFCIPKHAGLTCDLTRILIYVWFGF